MSRNCVCECVCVCVTSHAKELRDGLHPFALHSLGDSHNTRVSWASLVSFCPARFGLVCAGLVLIPSRYLQFTSLFHLTVDST